MPGPGRLPEGLPASRASGQRTQPSVVRTDRVSDSSRRIETVARQRSAASVATRDQARIKVSVTSRKLLVGGAVGIHTPATQHLARLHKRRRPLPLRLLRQVGSAHLLDRAGGIGGRNARPCDAMGPPHRVTAMRPSGKAKPTDAAVGGSTCQCIRAQLGSLSFTVTIRPAPTSFTTKH